MEPKTFSSFRERLYHLQANFHPFCSVIIYSLGWVPDYFWAYMFDCREPNLIGFALVDLVYMDGGFLHVETFKKEKWYVG